MVPDPFTLILLSLQVTSLLYLLISAPLNKVSPLLAIFYIAAVALVAWAMKHLKKTKLSILPEPRQGLTLITSGPFRWIRHPLYAALLLTALGLFFHNPEPIRGFVVLVLFATLTVKAIIEEDYLRHLFPEYEEYMKSTKRFIPFVF